MFGKLVTIFCALTITAVVFAKEEKVNKTVICDEAGIMLPWFGEKYGEEPMWIGVVKEPTAENDTVLVSVVVNEETQTWSIVLYDKTTSCILESGKGFKFRFPTKNTVNF